jgi:hypothetical protein
MKAKSDETNQRVESMTINEKERERDLPHPKAGSWDS